MSKVIHAYTSRIAQGLYDIYTERDDELKQGDGTWTMIYRSLSPEIPELLNMLDCDEGAQEGTARFLRQLGDIVKEPKETAPDEKAMMLWKLLDDIDTASDMFKPHDLESYQAYFEYVTVKHQERFKVFSSDGYRLFNTKQDDQGTEHAIDSTPEENGDSGNE